MTGNFKSPPRFPKKRSLWRRFMLAPVGRFLYRIGRYMPKGLFERALIIIVVPILLLQSIIAYVFIERHWQSTTSRLSAAVTTNVAVLVDIYESYPQEKDYATLMRIANDRLQLDVEILSDENIPISTHKPFFSHLDEALTQELSDKIDRPFWIDTIGRSNFVEIRIQLNKDVMRIFMRRSLAYASNSHILLVWMVCSALVLIVVALLFMRNQIRPIQKLVDAAEAFGRGQDLLFRPHGAREIRQAGQSFLEMKQRIERSLEQRTAMLNGVSHDLRTILTRFKLSLALLPENEDNEELKQDVDEMSRMLEAYLAFARSDDGNENAADTDIKEILKKLQLDIARQGRDVDIDIECPDEIIVKLRPDAFRRLVYNLTSNAARHGTHVLISVLRDETWLTVHVDDDGPGVDEHQREYIFKPFVRLDEARNQDEGGSGLGLAIARDLARSHGGDVTLSDSPYGGLRATIRLPI